MPSNVDLPQPDGPDQSHHLAGRNVQRNVVENEGSSRIGDSRARASDSCLEQPSPLPRQERRPAHWVHRPSEFNGEGGTWKNIIRSTRVPIKIDCTARRLTRGGMSEIQIRAETISTKPKRPRHLESWCQERP